MTASFELMKGALQTLERALFSLVQEASGVEAARGRTPRELSGLAESILRDAGAIPVLPDEVGAAGTRFGYAASVCVNDVAANGVPTRRPLAPGDLVTFDIALAVEGAGGRRAVVDGATTCVIPGGPAREDALRLVRAAREATRACVWGARPGVTPAMLREVARGAVRPYDMHVASIPLVHRVHQGRGPMHGGLGEQMPLQVGDVIAIEPLVVVGAGAEPLVLDDDGFTLRTAGGALAGYEECTIVVGDGEAGELVMPPAGLRPWLHG